MAAAECGGSSGAALADHVEFTHERELAPGTTPAEVRRMHTQMHANGDHWNHSHLRGGSSTKECCDATTRATHQ